IFIHKNTSYFIYIDIWSIELNTMGGRFNVSGYKINKFTSWKSLPLIRCNVMIYLVLFYLSFAR
ncbi:TPA: hypothetical protein ACIAC2_004676, partial [Escherichia coli]